MLVDPDYRGFRIQVTAVAAGDRWNAEARVRRLFSREKAHVEVVTCLKLTPEHAERSAHIWARRWVDLKAQADGALEDRPMQPYAVVTD